MASAETARLIASLELQDKFSATADRAMGKLGKLDASLNRSGGRAYKAGTQIGTGIKNGALIAAGAIGFLATNVAVGLRSLEKLEVATTQTNAVIKSTKGAADQTANSIRNLAEKYEALNATIGDEVIQSGENLLLTFTNIRKDAFEPALKAALDMNQAMGGGEEGLQGTIQKLGKALNDPIKGLTALGRVGITFTAQQKEQIKTAVEAGDTFKAQGIILAELDKRFGGSFLAGGSTTTAKVAKFRDSIEDLQRTLATALLPVIGKVADALSKFLNDPAVIKGAKDIGDSIAAMFTDKNLAQGADFLKGAFQTAKEAAPVVAAAAKATFEIVKAAVSLFKSLPPELQKLAVGAFAVNKLTGGLVTNIGGAIAGGLTSFLLKSFTGGMNVNAGVVNVNGVAGGLPGAAPAAGGKVGSLIGTAAKVIVPVAIASIAAEAAFAISGISDPRHVNPNSGTVFRGTNVASEQIENLLKVQAALQERANGGDTFAAKQLVGVNEALAKLLGEVKTQPTTIGGGITNALRNLGLGPAIDKGTQLAARNAQQIEAAENRVERAAWATAKGLTVLHSSFHADLVALKSATKANDIQKFAREIAKQVTGGKGSAAGTKAVLSDLKIKLAQTDDPKTRSVLKAAILAVQAKLPNREHVAQQLSTAKKIAAGTESVKGKLSDLKTIESQLRREGNTHAASVVRKLADNVSASNKTRAAAAQTAAEIRKKRWQFRVDNTIISNVAVSLRETIKTTTTAKRIGNVYLE